VNQGRATAKAVSRWPLAAEARVRALVNTRGICGGQDWNGFFSEFLSLSFHRGSPYSYITWGDDGRSSET
jgi:hypothetical protein